MIRPLRIAVAVLAAAGLLGTPLVAEAAAAEAKEWNQAAVTELARQLAAAAGDLRSSVRRAPQMSPTARNRRTRYRALDDLRVMQNSVNSLVRQLEAGEGREATYPTYRRIGSLRRDIAQSARRAFITEPTLGKLEAARGLLDELAPYYAPEVDADEEIEAGDG